MMRMLEFENFDMGGNQNENPLDDTQLYIDYSIKVVDYLKAKSEATSDDEKGRVSLDQLKKVFVNSAASYREDSEVDINYFVLARINMYLAVKSGRELTYDKDIKLKDFLDASSIIIPTEQDFIQAKEDMEKYGLDLNYNSIDNLYIYTKNDKLHFDWE